MNIKIVEVQQNPQLKKSDLFYGDQNFNEDINWANILLLNFTTQNGTCSK